MHIEIHGDPAGPRVAFQAALQRQCDELSIMFTTSDDVVADMGKTPTVSIMFPSAGSNWSAADAGRFDSMAQATHAVLPVIARPDEARFLPAALARFNAFQTSLWGSTWATGLVDEVLSLGWQRRRERRVFISYKRSDSGPVARQLYEELTLRGYHTFLDDVSIDRGVDFQHGLKWWLNDADVVLVLISPHFENSRWCMEEITFAQSTMVGLLGIEWPHSVLDDPPRRAFLAGSQQPPRQKAGPASVASVIDPDQRLRLEDADFEGAAAMPLSELPLNDAGLAKVIAHCAHQRALAIRLRLENLIPLAERVLKPNGTFKPVGTLGDYTFQDAAGAAHFVRILPFRPDARSLHEAYQSAGALAHVGCFYGEFDSDDPRAKAMRWLATGRQDTESASRRTTIWPCLGDRLAP